MYSHNISLFATNFKPHFFSVNADGKGTTPAKVPAENSYKFKVTIGEKIKDLLRPAMLRPLVLVVSYFFFYNCASLNAIRPYMVPVFQKLRLPKDPHFVAVSILNKWFDLKKN